MTLILVLVNPEEMTYLPTRVSYFLCPQVERFDLVQQALTVNFSNSRSSYSTS